MKLKIKFSRLFWIVVFIEVSLSALFFFFLYSFPELIQKSYVGTIYMVFGGILLVTFFISLFAILESIKIIRLIEKISQFSHRIAYGDFQTEIKSKRKDELGTLIEDLEQMKITLGDSFRKLKKEKEKTETIIKNMQNGVIVLDQRGKIVLMNIAAKRMTGQSTKPYRGKNYQEILSIKGKEEDSFDLKSWINKTIQARKNINLPENCFLQLPSKEEIAIEGTIFPLLGRKEGVDNLVFVFSDVTARREVERMRAEFVFILSHQLQEPITSIKWNTELLLENKSKDLTEIQKTSLGDIYQSTAKMIDLFNNLLNVSDIANGKLSLKLTPTQIKKMVQEIIDGLQPLAKSRNIKLITQFEENLPLVNIDRLKINQAIQNIIENAICYGKVKGRVVVSLKKEKEEIVFSCQDDGIGITAKAQSKIFYKFFRADNAKQKLFKGSGLGLYIAKIFVEKMPGGKIWFHSGGLNLGSVFYISFPIYFSKK